MTRIDKIRAEIERKLNIAEYQAQKAAEEDNYEAHLQWTQEVAVCNELLRFIDSLSEQPVKEPPKPLSRCGIGRHFFIFEKTNKKQPASEEQEKKMEFCKTHCKGYSETGGKCFFDGSCDAKRKATQEQEVDLEKEISRWVIEDCGPSDFDPYADHWCADDIQRTARHFYELGKNAK